jgi:MFS family permease
MVGIACAFETLFAIITSFFLAKIIAKFRLMNSLKFAAIFYAIATILLYFYFNFWLWLLLISVTGSCWFIYAISRLSWLNILLNNNNRGVGIGIFSMIISLGVGIGPLIVKTLGANSFFSFLASAFLTLCSFWFLLPLKKLPNSYNIKSQ